MWLNKAALTIDPKTVEISFNQKLSYSSAPVIILALQVMDRNSKKGGEEQVATAKATLYIQDFNADNPVFPPPWNPSDPIIQINTGQQVSYYQKLSLDRNMGDIIQVSPYGEVISNQLLDYEQVKPISFAVATMMGEDEQEQSSEGHVTLNLVDVNDKDTKSHSTILVAPGNPKHWQLETL